MGICQGLGGTAKKRLKSDEKNSEKKPQERRQLDRALCLEGSGALGHITSD